MFSKVRMLFVGFGSTAVAMSDDDMFRFLKGEFCETQKGTHSFAIGQYNAYSNRFPVASFNNVDTILHVAESEHPFGNKVLHKLLLRLHSK